ncbi:hypothetical protein [Mycobacterium sp.]|uniref:hypothetical protein n=1 Tax=Mycobacterium sp. TaxID=1785 RepID=UPI003A8A8DF2
MTTMQSWINKSPLGVDILLPMRARAGHAVDAMLRARTPRRIPGPRHRSPTSCPTQSGILMEPGIERC